MKIYVAQQYHDYACGIFSTLEMALSHIEQCRYCEIDEYELCDGEFKQTDLNIRHWYCENCGKTGRTDQSSCIDDGYDYCSEECRKETRDFYDSGNRGIHGKTTQQMKKHIASSLLAGIDPMKGCASTNSGVRPSPVTYKA